MDQRLLTRIVLRNYKNIAACDVAPAQISFLVGPNGSGKSNFLDALRFIADALRFSLEHALRKRGGINEVCRRSRRKATHFGMRIEFNLGDARGHYAFRIGTRPRSGYKVQDEECQVRQRSSTRRLFYKIRNGEVDPSTTLSPAPAAAVDRLYLVTVSGVDAFRTVYDALSGSGFYNLNPDAIRKVQQSNQAISSTGTAATRPACWRNSAVGPPRSRSGSRST